MKIARLLLFIVPLLLSALPLFAEPQRTVDPLILPVWHQDSPWNARCPGQGPNRANAGSHALALAKTMKYWAYPTYGIGNVSYVDDDFGPINSSFTNEIMWNNMSNTLVFQTTQRFIFMCGASIYTDYEYDFSTSSLTNVRNALINNFSYDDAMQYQDREDYGNFYWKSMIREELDEARPVIYMVQLANGNEVAFIIDGYDDAGLFHINWSDVDYTDGWFDLNDLIVGSQVIPVANQHMLTGIQPSNGPDNIDENFETDFSNWNWQFAGHQNWTISTEEAFFGSQSAKSGNIDDNQFTSMFIQINVTNPDTISFYKKVSCEAEPDDLYDHLAFFIDNVEQERWSGDGSWAFHEYPVSPGVHEFRWTYSKDGASDYFSDCAWVDAIDLPEGTTPLNAPQFVEAEVSGGNDVQINWAPPPGTNPTLLGYKVYRNGAEIVQFSNPSITTYNDSNLPNGDYTYLVRGVYVEGISGPSNSSSVTVEVPYAPTNLSASLIGMNTGHLVWDAPPVLRNRALMGYVLYRDNVAIAQIENPETLEYNDSGLTQGVYYYEVTAVYSIGESARSNMAQLAVGVPYPPGNLQAVVSGSTVNLSWSQVPNTDFLVGFKIFRNGQQIATLSDPLQMQYSDQNLANGSYSYYLRAIYTDGDSGNSATVTVSVEVPYPPANLVANVNGDDVQLSWSNPEATRALTHYLIYRNGQVIAATYGANSTIYLDQNLANGNYTYQVTAFYSGVQSPYSNSVDVLIEVLYPPRNLNASVTLANVTLNWTIPANQGGLRSFNGYNVYRDNVLVTYINNPALLSYTDHNVPNGIYTYEVSAVYSTGESARASVQNVLVEVLYPVDDLSYQISEDDVTLSWSVPGMSSRENSSNRALLYYHIYRNGSFYAQAPANSYLDADLANGIYSYYVTAVYGTGESNPSQTVTLEIEVLYPPTALLATVTDDDVTLNWTAPLNSGGLSRAFVGYQLYKDGSLLASTTALSYSDNNLANGTYAYYVVAEYAGGFSAPTATVNATVEVLYPPSGLQATVQNKNNISLAWQAPPSSGGLRSLQYYQVTRNGTLLTEVNALAWDDLAVSDGVYAYEVRAVYDSGLSEPCVPASVFIEYPYPPANVAATVNGADVSITWDVVTGTEVQYLLYRNGNLLATTTQTSYLDTGLDNGSYTYFVITTNASDSGPSEASLNAIAEVYVPYPPQMLTGSVSGSTVSLAWSAPATGPRVLSNYNVYRNGALIGTAITMSYTDGNLNNGIYSYYVTAVYDSGESIPSNTVVLEVEVLYPATELQATVDLDDVTLGWTAASTGTGRAMVGYKVFRNNSEIALITDTTYTDLNLANGSYSYYVTAVYDGGSSAPSNTVTATVEVLYAPSALEYTINNDSIILSWTAAATSSSRDFLGYNIYRDNVVIAQSQTTSYTDPDLANGIYQYYVTALYSSGESAPTNLLSISLEVLYPATGLSCVVSLDDVSLSWTAPVNSGGLRNLLGYKVLRDEIQIAFTNDANYQDNDLANGIYHYSVIAHYGSGDAIPTPLVEAVIEVLYPPVALVYAVEADAVVLQWTPAATSARSLLGYNVYRDNSLLASSISSSYTDADLANGTYTYYVTANYSSGESLPTNAVTAAVEVLYPPTGLSYSISDDDISLQWTAAAISGGLRTLTSYNVYRDGTLLGQTASLNYTDSDLANGTYSYYVTATYDTGTSAASNTVTALLEVYYPATALSATVQDDDISLSWTAAAVTGGLRSITGYRVYRNNAEIAYINDVTFLDQNLSNGLYSYYVVAQYQTGVSLPSNEATAVVEVLYSPSELVYSTNDDSIVLSWTAAPTGPNRSLTGYSIYRDGINIAQTTSTGYPDANLPNGTYQYYVTAMYSSGESLPSNTITVNLEVLYPATGLSCNVSGDDVSLSWNLPVTSGGLRNLLGYKVIRDGVQIAFSNTESYQDNNLPNGIYYYSIIASYTSGDALPTPLVQAVVEVLYPPTALLYEVQADTVNLEWTSAATSVRGFSGYNVYRDGSLIANTSQSSYSDTSLANGIYSYQVTALYSSGESISTNTIQATVEVLYPPTGLAYSISDDDITLQWTAATTSGGLRSFTGYDLYRDGALLIHTNSLGYTDSNLANGTYSYYVTATYDSGTSLPSNTVNVLLEVFYPATSLAAVVTDDDISLSWAAASTSGGLRAIQGYKVYRDGSEIAMVTGTSYLDQNLGNGSYQYYVIAQYETGASAPSNTATAIVEVLYPPTALNYAVSGNSISLSWVAASTSPARNFIGYNIYRDGSYLAQTSGTAYTDNGLANGSYQYYVSALYSSGESIFSNSITATVEVLYPVTALGASVNEDNVTLSWTLPAVNQQRSFLGYFIYRNGFLHTVLNDPSISTWTDSGLANGEYSYYLIAMYDSGLSLPSNTVTVNVMVMPNLPAPTGLTATIQGERDVVLSWQTPAANVQFYRVYRNNIEITTTTNSSYSDLALPNGSYAYYIKAQYAEGLSSASETAIVNIMIAEAPGAFSVSVVNSNSAQLGWSAPNQNEIGYLVYRNGNELIYLPGAASTSYTDQNLANGTYSYQVAAVYPNVISSPTIAIPVNIEVIYMPTDFALQTTGNAVQLGWNAPADTGGLQHYKIYRNGTLLIQTLATQYTDYNLANGSYIYQLSAVYSVGESALTAPLNANIELAYPPSGLSAIVTDDSIALSWFGVSDPGGLINYRIYRNGIFLSTATTLQYLDSALANGDYSYYVTAMYAVGESTPTNTASATVEVRYPATALQFNVIDNDVFLSWTAPVNSGGLRNLTGYKIFRDNIQIGTATQTTYTDLDLGNGTYQYYVVASYNSGDAAPTAPVSVLIEILYPAANLQYQVNGASVSLSWDAVPPSGATLLGYNVYRNGLLLIQTTITNYTDNGLNNGSYSYYVSARYASGESLPTNTIVANVEVLYAPSNLVAVVNNANVNLTWTASPTGPRSLLEYVILRNGEWVGNTETTSFTDVNPGNGSYSYTVHAEYTSGTSALSNTATANVLVAYPPVNAFLQQVTYDDSVTITWNAPADTGGLTAYRVYRNSNIIYTGMNLFYTDQDMANGNYTYYITSMYGTLESTPSSNLPAVVMVTYPPQNLTGSITGNNVSISWASPSDPWGLTNYRVWMNSELQMETTSTTATISDLDNGTYNFQITAIYPSGQSAYSNTYTAEVIAAYPPQNATCTVNGNDVSIQWNQPQYISGLTNYRILRDDVQIGQTTSLSYQDNDLANANYHYTVVAVFGTHLSNPADAGTAHVEIIYPPTAPMVQVNITDVVFSWTAVADPGFLMYYRVFRNGTQIAELNNPAYTDEDLSNGTYSYTVQAVYQAGSSAQTAPAVAEVMIPYPPRNLSYEGPGSVIYLSWQAPVDMGGFSEYRVSRNGTLLGTTASTSFVDTIVPNGQYTYQVAAVYSNSQSAAAEVSFENIIAYPAQNLTYELQQNRLSLQWEAPADSYGLVEYQVINGSGTLLAKLNTDQTSCIFDDLSNGMYRIWIRTVYSGGVMLGIQEFTWINVLVPYTVEGLSIEAVSDSSLVHVAWVNPIDLVGFTTFRITRNGIQIAETTELSYTDTNVPNGGYRYGVAAVYGDLVSTELWDMCVIHLAAPVRNVLAAVDGEAYLVTWDAPVSLSLPDYYEVFFLVDGQQQAPASWTYVARVDSLVPVIDEAHGGLNNGDFLWAVFAMWNSGDGLPAFSNILHVEPIVPPIPEVTKLKGNFPNPFNPHTTIKFDLHQDSPVKLCIYNSRGQLVRKLYSGNMLAGEQQLPFDGKDDNGRLLSSGLYIYRLETKGYTKTKKMMLMK